MSHIEPNARSAHRSRVILHDLLSVRHLKDSYTHSRHPYRNRLAVERGKLRWIMRTHPKVWQSRVPTEILARGYPAYED
jgi:hypothetical protein